MALCVLPVESVRLRYAKLRYV